MRLRAWGEGGLGRGRYQNVTLTAPETPECPGKGLEPPSRLRDHATYACLSPLTQIHDKALIAILSSACLRTHCFRVWGLGLWLFVIERVVAPLPLLLLRFLLPGPKSRSAATGTHCPGTKPEAHTVSLWPPYPLAARGAEPLAFEAASVQTRTDKTCKVSGSLFSGKSPCQGLKLNGLRHRAEDLT